MAFSFVTFIFHSYFNSPKGLLSINFDMQEVAGMIEWITVAMFEIRGQVLSNARIVNIQIYQFWTLRKLQLKLEKYQVGKCLTYTPLCFHIYIIHNMENKVKIIYIKKMKFYMSYTYHFFIHFV